MIQSYCPNCRSVVGFKRNLGWGTFFGCIVTFGILLFLIPFYPKRCVKCGSQYDPKLLQNQPTYMPIVDSKTTENNLAGVHKSVLVECPNCNNITRGDIDDCMVCHMFIPEDVKKKMTSVGLKKCPYCAEDILIEAIKCKHCGSMLENKA